MLLHSYRVGGSFELQYGCCPRCLVGWPASSAVLLLFWLSVVSSCSPFLLNICFFQKKKSSFLFIFSFFFVCFFTASSLVCWLAHFCPLPACSLRFALHGQITLLCLKLCISVSQLVITELVSCFLASFAYERLRFAHTCN